MLHQTNPWLHFSVTFNGVMYPLAGDSTSFGVLLDSFSLARHITSRRPKRAGSWRPVLSDFICAGGIPLALRRHAFPSRVSLLQVGCAGCTVNAPSHVCQAMILQAAPHCLSSLVSSSSGCVQADVTRMRAGQGIQLSSFPESLGEQHRYNHHGNGPSVPRACLHFLDDYVVREKRTDLASQSVTAPSLPTGYTSRDTRRHSMARCHQGRKG